MSQCLINRYDDLLLTIGINALCLSYLSVRCVVINNHLVDNLDVATGPLCTHTKASAAVPHEGHDCFRTSLTG